jgi:hypothetical protein
MLKDFLSENELNRMREKVIAEQSIIKAREKLEQSRKENDSANRNLLRLKSEQESLESIKKFNPLIKALSSFFRRGKFFEYTKQSEDLSAKIEAAERRFSETKTIVESSEKILDEAIKHNDGIVCPKQYEKSSDDILIVNDLDGLTHEKAENLSREKSVIVHCTDFFPFSREIVSNFEGGKVSTGTLKYHGVSKYVSTISNRHEVHYTVNARVESTSDGAGNWDYPKFIIVDVMDNNEGLNQEDVESGDPSDSWTKGKSIKLSSHAVVLVREDALKELNLSPKDIKKYNIVIYRGNPTKCLKNFLTLNGYKIQETNRNFNGHASSIRMKQEYAENLRNYAINYVTNEPVLTQEKPVLNATQLGRVADVYMHNNPKIILFSSDGNFDELIDTLMKGYDIVPEDREKYIEAINFVILTGLKRTDDRKGYTFKDSEQIIADLRSFYHWVDEMISLDSLILPSTDLVFEVFQARKKAEMEYSKLGTPSIESIKELTMEDLYKFENQKSAEVVSGSVKEFGGEVIRFASKEVELGKRNLGATDLGLKYRKAVKENMDMPKCYGTTDFSYYDDFLSVFFSGKIKVSELAHYFEKNTELAKKIDNIKLESLEGDKKTAEEDSRPSDFE